jgi:hypothetical protein
MKKLLTILVLVVTWGTCDLYSGQTIDSIEPDPPGTIDGKRNPELIPDNIAYELFYRTMCSNPAGWDLETRKASLKNTNFSEAQVAIIIQHANLFAEGMAYIEQKAAQIREQYELGSAQANTQLAEIQKQRIQLVEATTSAIIKSLPSEGAKNLQEYVGQIVKSKIKMLPE